MKKLVYVFLLTVPLLFISCDNDDDGDDLGEFMGDSKTYQLQSKSDASISGTADIVENADGTATVNIKLNGTTAGSHPSHIHVNSAAEGGDIAIDLTPVDGASGESTTIISATNSGTAITYAELLEFDGYINVHQSSDDLGTLIAQGDIGVNELTGESKAYALSSVSEPAISGTATFSQRVSGAALLEIALEGTSDGGEHPAHIHVNSAAEGGAIAISLNAIDGATGKSSTHIEADDEDTAITYEALLDFDGYINVHESPENLATLIAQGDIGGNELTGETKEYALNSVTVPTISGTATFSQRVSGAAVLEIELEGTPADGEHPAHIHVNTAAEGGAIAISLNSVDGATGKSVTHIEANDEDTAVTYEALLDYDGYINVHLSAEALDVLVAQGDIGQNELTGNEASYDLAAVSDATIFGTATFAERVNGETLVVLALDGTTAGDVHPAHIHMGSVANAPGDIMVTLTSVMGETGLSSTNVTQLDNDGEALDYTAMTSIDGYINVHLSVDDLATLVAQGDVGANVD